MNDNHAIPSAMSGFITDHELLTLAVYCKINLVSHPPLFKISMRAGGFYFNFLLRIQP